MQSALPMSADRTLEMYYSLKVLYMARMSQVWKIYDRLPFLQIYPGYESKKLIKLQIIIKK